MKNLKWHFRRNEKRKIAGDKRGSHPSIVFGETDDGSSYFNIGLTNAKKEDTITILKYIIQKIGQKVLM